jgi:signal transduction histidine kinase
VSRLLRRIGRVDWRVWDVVMAIAFVVGGVAEIFGHAHGHPAALTVIGPAAAYATLAHRRRWPLAAGALFIAIWLAEGLWVFNVQPLNLPLLGVLVISYSMGRYTEGLASPVSFVLALGGLLAVASTMPGNTAGDFAFPAAFAVIAWGAGHAVRTRSRLTEELHEAAARAEEDHETELAHAAAEERRRIAREMHDVVAHSVSVMVVQAGGARRILDHDPARAVEAAAHIEDTGRAALVEMRRLLGVLHHGEETDAERAPAPGLGRLDALVARSRAAGLPVELTVEGAPRSLPAGLDLAAYRVLQEGLTNAIRYAGTAPTDVVVRWGEDRLELTVADRGPGPSLGDGRGHGLVGMRERMRLYGGELQTGLRDGGGFEVRAQIPLEPQREVLPA